MITNIVATVVVSLFTNVHEHQWSQTLKTQVCEVNEATVWKFPGYDIPDRVVSEQPISQTTILFTLQNGQWVEMPNGRTSGIFVLGATGWIYVPHPNVCPSAPALVPCPNPPMTPLMYGLPDYLLHRFTNWPGLIQ